uniref:DDE-1 domain-containing protein n=1 Tax=Latimeria chalumnae TaxID=7897 RepID=H3AHE0_LATCH
MYRFILKKKNGIRQFHLAGENLSADTSEIKPFFEKKKKKKKKNILQLQSQMYNASETGLYYKMYPQRSTWAQQKDCITILGCANASGDPKLKLLLIGKKKNKYTNTNMHKLPAKYTAQKNAWMDYNILTDSFVFFNAFVPEVSLCTKNKLAAKAALLIDNTPSHSEEETPASQDGNMKCTILPPNTAPRLQPCDQGILETLNRIGKDLSISSEKNSHLSVADVIKSVTVKDALYMATEAWDHVSSVTISKSWTKSAIATPAESETPEEPLSDMEAMRNLAANFSVNEEELDTWMNCDNGESGHEEYMAVEIVQ